MANKDNKKRKRKRKFYGNRYTCSLAENKQSGEAKETSPVQLEERCYTWPRPVSCSTPTRDDFSRQPTAAKKPRLEEENLTCTDKSLNKDEAFMLINMSALQTLLDLVGKCPQCASIQYSMTLTKEKDLQIF